MRSSVAAVLVLLASTAGAETAILELRAEARHTQGTRSTRLFHFRTASAENWRITDAQLLLHIDSRSAPRHLRVSLVEQPWPEEAAGKVRLSRRTSLAVEAMPHGWLNVKLPAELAQALVTGKAAGLAIEERGFQLSGGGPGLKAPYLMVHGTR